MKTELSIGNSVGFIPSYTGATTVTGKVTGHISYAIAKVFGDISATHAAVKMLKPSIDPIETLEFFTLDKDGITSVFAEAWITDGTLSVITPSKYTDVRVWGVDASNLAELRAYLQTGGYTVTTL